MLEREKVRIYWKIANSSIYVYGNFLIIAYNLGLNNNGHYMDTIYQPALDDTQNPMTLIWLHGLGVDGSDFEEFQQELSQFGEIQNLNIVLPTAPTRTISVMKMSMPGWYDLFNDTFQCKPGEVVEEDIEGMNASMAIVQSIIDDERKKNPDTPIWLGGFSQGAAIALLTGYSQTIPLQGIIALSGYVPNHPRFDELSDLARQTPTFIAHGTLDTVISIAKARDGVSHLNAKGATIEFYEYPMMHELCPDEIHDIGDFIMTHAPKTAEKVSVTEESDSL